MPTNPPFAVLVFSKTTGYRHTCIPAALSSIHTLSTQTKLFTVSATEDASLFTPSTLSHYAVIILLHCIGDIFAAPQLSALKTFVRNGGGVVAIHGAAAAMPGDEWYARLIGAGFDMHPPAERGTVLVDNTSPSPSHSSSHSSSSLKNKNHYILGPCTSRQDWMDEWYNFRTHPRDNSNLEILLRGETSSFKGGRMGEDHPLSWCQEFEGGRSFFTALGHFDEAYGDEWFVGQVLRGVLWVGGREEGDGVGVVGEGR